MPESTFGSTAKHSQVQSNGFHGAADTLPTVAGQINAYMEKAEQSAEKARQQRVSAGQLLIEARRCVDDGEAGDTTWTEWVRNNIKRSLRDCQRVMKIAGAPDPDAVLAKEHEDARVGMARSRERGDKRLSPLEADHLAAARDALAAMPEDQRVEFLVEQVKVLSRDARAKLVGIIRETMEGGDLNPKGETPNKKQQDRKLKDTGSGAPELAENTRRAPDERPRATVNNIFGGDDTIVASELYQRAVTMFSALSDKAEALAFARDAYRRKRSGESPMDPTEWQSFCWAMPDEVRGAFVRHNIAPTA
jgi:hypothetical protein